MTEGLVSFFTGLLSGTVSKEAIVFIISMIPILELRGGLIAASLLHIEMYRAILFCAVGNIIPIPFILMFISAILNWMKKFKCFEGLVAWLERKSMSKSDKIKKYEFLGLVLFVGIPLPGTGAWTGALIASLLKIDIKKAFLAILCGIAMATVIMCLLTYALPAVIGALA